MGNYIDRAQHRGAVRCVQLLAYLTLLGVLTVVVMFIVYSLKEHDAKDTYISFVMVLLSLLGSALNCAVGISLPHNGKFGYFKIPLHVFIISDIIGVGYGARQITAKGQGFNDVLPFIFYTSFYLGLLVCSIIILRYFIGTASKRSAVISGTGLILFTLLHHGDIIYCMINSDAFVDALPNKDNLIRLSCNSVILLTVISTMIVICIKPRESEHTHSDPLRDQ